MTKVYDVDVHRHWIVKAPDDMSEEAILERVVPDMMNVDPLDIADISQWDESEIKYSEASSANDPWPQWWDIEIDSQGS